MAKSRLYLRVDERHAFPARQGNGWLRRQVWVDESERVVKYSLAYVNFNLCQKDNGRVLGFDMAHGFHHEHRMGWVTEVAFENFEALEKRFEKEFRKFHEQARRK